MTKEIAHFPTASCTQLVEVLQSLGWRFEHPINSRITGWSNQGEEIILMSAEEAAAFLAAAVGHGVQLWADPDKDLFISCEKALQIYFDEFSPEESALLQTAMRVRGLRFEVRDYS